jgi:hypothetical protein
VQWPLLAASQWSIEPGEDQLDRYIFDIFLFFQGIKLSFNNLLALAIKQG